MKPNEYQTLLSGGVSYRFGNQIPIRGREPGQIARIFAEVCEKYGITKAELLSRSRKRQVAWIRFEAIHRLRQIIINGKPMSLPRIGELLGGMDHTSCMAALRRYGEIMAYKSANGLEMDTIFLPAEHYDIFSGYSTKRRRERGR